MKDPTDEEFPTQKIGIYKEEQIICKEMTVKENLLLYSLVSN